MEHHRRAQARRDRGAEGRVDFNDRGQEPRLGVQQEHLPRPVGIRRGRGSRPCEERPDERTHDDPKQTHPGILARAAPDPKPP